jgi:hypothetical protein
LQISCAYKLTMRKTDPTSPVSVLRLEEPHTPPLPEEKPPNLRSLQEPGRISSRPSRLSSKQRALFRMASSHHFAEDQAEEKPLGPKQGPESSVVTGSSDRGTDGAPSKLSLQEAVRVIGEFSTDQTQGGPQETSLYYTANPDFLLDEETRGEDVPFAADSVMIGRSKPSQGGHEAYKKGPTAQGSHKIGERETHASRNKVDQQSVPSYSRPSPLSRAGELRLDNAEFSGQPYKLPAPEAFDVHTPGKHAEDPVLKGDRVWASGSDSGSESVENEAEGYQARKVGSVRSARSFQDRLRAYEALNWESSGEEEIEARVLKASGERRGNGEMRENSWGSRKDEGMTEERGNSDKWMKFATVGGRLSAAYDIRGSPISHTKSHLVDDGGLIGR